MSAYIEDINLEKIDWKVFSDILKGSSMYELIIIVTS